MGFQLREATQPAEKVERGPQLAKEAEVVSGATMIDNTVRVITTEQALKLPSVQRALVVRGTTIGMMKPHLQRKSTTHGGNYEDVDYGMTNYLMQVQPNPTMNATDFWCAIEMMRCLGNAVVYMKREGFTLKGLYLCSHAQVYPDTLDYLITYQSEYGTVTDVVPYTDVLHFKGDFLTEDGLSGKSLVQMSADALSLMATNNRRAKDIAAKGGDMKYLVSEDNKNPQVGATRRLTQEQKTSQQDSIQKQMDERKSVILCSGLIDIKPITEPGAIQALDPARKADVLEICRIFSVPPPSMFELTNNTYKSPEQGTMELLQRTIQPARIRYENELNAKLIGPSGFGKLRFCMDEKPLMQLDPMAMAEMLEKYIQNGIYCPDEARLELNLPALEKGKGGDQHLVSTNLQKLDDIKLGKNQAEPTQTKTKTKTKTKKGEEDE